MTIETTDAQTPEQQEHFHIETFRYVEKNISVFRRALMKAAADIAKARQPDAVVFDVERQDVDEALRLHFPAFDAEALGALAGPPLPELQSEPS